MEFVIWNLSQLFPVLFSIGNLTVYTSSLIIAIGFLVSLFFFWKLSRAEIIEEEKIFDFILLFIIGAMIVGRMVYVLENMNDFQFKIDRAIHIYKYPGFNLWGVLIGGFAASFNYARYIKIKKARLSDYLAIGFSCYLSFVFLGYFFDGVYAGFATPVFGINFVGYPGKRFPLQLPASAVFLLLFYIAKKKVTKLKPGLIFWIFLCIFFTSLLVLEFLRHDRIYFESTAINKLLFFVFAMFSSVVIMLKYKYEK